MNEQNELAQKRDAIIEQIKQVFPKNPPEAGLNLIRDDSWHQAAVDRLQEMLEGKHWQEVIDHRSVGYNFTEVDHLIEITNEAYRYYLPAFLVASMLNPNIWFGYRLAMEKMSGLISQFSFEQLAVLIAYFMYQLQDLQKRHDYFEEENVQYRGVLDEEPIEVMLVRLLIRRDELADKLKR